jgi:alanine racemase
MSSCAPDWARPIRCCINLEALRHNYALARSCALRIRKSAQVWAVVKADAYGHGLCRVASALTGLADGFALVERAGAQQLRESGISAPLLMLEGFYRAGDVEFDAHWGLTPVIHHVEQLDWLEAVRLPAPLPVYLKINTGMNRLGFAPTTLPDVIKRLRACAQVGPITLMTHFADADGPSGVQAQLDVFHSATADFALPSSLANSAALLRYPQTVTDWVRPGIMLYGSSPYPDRESASGLGLRPVMTLRSELIGVEDIDAGQTVGYGRTFCAPSPMRVGVVACGYADGYPRHAPTGTPVLVAGQRTRTLGRVSMDKVSVDLSPISDAHCGSPVTLWGEGLDVDEVAAACATISYELLCAVSARVPVVEMPL